ncbi:MAG: HEAT repeat domain-containing protein [Promethearchaeota archaeon]
MKDLIQTLNSSDDQNARARAVEALGWNKEKKAGKVVLKTLEDGSPVVRKTAVWAAARLGLKKAIPKLRSMIQDPREEFSVQKAAIGALQDLDAASALDVLLEALKSENLLFIDIVAKALGAKGLDAVPPLLDIVAGKDEGPRLNAARAVAECSDDPVALIIERLRKYGPEEKMRLIDAFGSVGGAVAVKVLLVATFDHSVAGQVKVSTRAKYLLRNMDIVGVKHVIFVYLDLPGEYRIDPVNLIPELWGEKSIQPLLEEYPMLEEEAKGAVEKILGWYAGKAIHAIVPMLGSLDAIVRDATFELLLKVAPAAPTLGPVVEHLEDTDPKVRRRLVQLLGKLGKPDPRVLEGLVKALGDENAKVRQKAAWSLGKLRQPESIGPLIHHLKDPDEKTRVSVAWALSQFDPSLEGLSPELVFERVVNSKGV